MKRIETILILTRGGSCCRVGKRALFIQPNSKQHLFFKHIARSRGVPKAPYRRSLVCVLQMDSKAPSDPKHSLETKSPDEEAAQKKQKTVEKGRNPDIEAWLTGITKDRKVLIPKENTALSIMVLSNEKLQSLRDNEAERIAPKLIPSLIVELDRKSQICCFRSCTYPGDERVQTFSERSYYQDHTVSKIVDILLVGGTAEDPEADGPWEAFEKTGCVEGSLCVFPGLDIYDDDTLDMSTATALRLMDGIGLLPGHWTKECLTAVIDGIVDILEGKS